MKKATLENYPETIQEIVKLCDELTNDIQGIKVIPVFAYNGCKRWKRINHCQAWFCESWFKGDEVTFIRSYDTVVAFLYKGVLYSLGRYSMTTYQHIRKFRNNYTRDTYNTPEKNLGLVDWF